MLRLASLAAVCGAALGGAGGPKSPPDPEAARHDLHAKLEEFIRSRADAVPALRRDVSELNVAISPGGKLQRLSNALARLMDSKAAHPHKRRLWGWPEVNVDPSEIGDAAGSFVDENTDAAGDFILDAASATEGAIDSSVGAFSAIQAQFGEITGLMDACKEVLDSAWAATTGFGAYMDGIFGNFGKIEAYFESPFGIVPLLSSQEAMTILVQTVDMLLDSTTQIRIITQAVSLMAAPLNTVMDALDSAMQKLNGLAGRRLLTIVDLGDLASDIGNYAPNFDYSNLLAGLDLSEIPQVMQYAVEEAEEIGNQINKVKDVLRPAIDKLKEHYGVEYENENEGKGDEPSELTGNETGLAEGASSTETERRMQAQLAQLQRRLTALDALGIGPDAGESAWSRGLDRRLVEDISEVEKDRQKYENALLSILPAWRSAETLAKDSCIQVELATQKIDSLVCRVQTFISQPGIPGSDAVEAIATKCDAESEKNVTVEGSCPEKVQSEGIRDAFSGSAGFISYAFALIEYTVQNYRFVSIVMACVLLAIGIVLAFVGYYVKEGVEFFQGCCGGLVLWSMGISVMVLWYDMCRGATFFPDCDPLFLMIVVLVLSILSGVLTWKMHWERVEAFLSGFTTGAFAGGAYYIIMYRDELLGGFLDADSAKPYMLSLMIVMVLVGLVVAALTQVLFRQLLMMGTAIVGACLIVCSFLIFIPHWWSTYDWVAWGVLSVAGYLVQLLITPPEYEMMSKEEMQEYKKNKNKDGGKL